MTAQRARIVALLGLALSTGCMSKHRTEELNWRGAIAPGATLHIRDLNGEIVVHAASDSAVAVHGTVEWHRGRNSGVKFVTARDGNDYYVCAVWGDHGRCGKNGYRSSTGLGLLSAFSLFHRRNDAHANLDITVPAGVAIDARTTNGTVTIKGARGPVTARTTNGSIAADATGNLDAETVNGSIVIAAQPGAQGAAWADTIRAVSVNGDVQATVPAGFQGAFALSTASGMSRSTISPAANGAPLQGRRIAATIGHGTALVTLKTVNGSATLTTR